jgi:hypothetical protein
LTEIQVNTANSLAKLGRAFTFVTFAASALAGPNLDVLMNAAASYSIAINQQLQMLHSNPPVAAFAEKTLNYAQAKRSYFEALQTALPILANASTDNEERSPEIDKFAAALAVAGEEQQKVADQETSALLARFARDPRIEKVKIEFERARKVEQNLRKELDRLGVGMSGVTPELAEHPVSTATSTGTDTDH